MRCRHGLPLACNIEVWPPCSPAGWSIRPRSVVQRAFQAKSGHRADVDADVGAGAIGGKSAESEESAMHSATAFIALGVEQEHLQSGRRDLFMGLSQPQKQQRTFHSSALALPSATDTVVALGWPMPQCRFLSPSKRITGCGSFSQTPASKSCSFNAKAAPIWLPLLLSPSSFDLPV
jgi:hypothetical protein